MGLKELFYNNDIYHISNKRIHYPVIKGYVHNLHHPAHEHVNNKNWIDILQKIRRNKMLKPLVKYNIGYSVGSINFNFLNNNSATLNSKTNS